MTMEELWSYRSFGSPHEAGLPLVEDPAFTPETFSD